MKHEAKKRMIVLLTAAAVSLTMVLRGEDSSRAGRFFLVDQRTQVPVASCLVPPNWLAGGKTMWTAQRELPVSWYVWSLSPDQKTKIIFSSQWVFPVQGRLRQSPLLQNPRILADQLAPAIQKDHNLSGFRLVDAKFNPQQADPKLISARLRQARERGIQPTDMLFTELVLRCEGERGGEKMSAFLSLPILAMENRPGMGYVSIAEVLMPMSFSCPAGTEQATQKTLQQIVTSVQMNPAFISMVNQITERRVSEWIRVQNQIHAQQMELASSSSKTQDKVRNMWSEYIRDVEPVTNPGTGEKMLVDTRYDHAWTNSEGEVIYHNTGFNTPSASTASFDPNSNALFNKTSWQKLK